MKIQGKVIGPLLDAIADALHWTGATSAIRMHFGGRGAILLMHEVHTDADRTLGTGVSVAFLDQALGWLSRTGWLFVSLDEALRRAEARDRRRFVALTFDDGYRNTLTCALPILEKHRAPFTIYVPTGAVTRTLNAWWLALRELFLAQDTVTIEPMGRRFECRDYSSKARALSDVVAWVHEDLRRSSLIQSVVIAAGISMQELNERHFLAADDLRRLSRHPLASIQAHTTSHRALSFLDEDSVRREMSDNRVYLEELTQAPIRHFAYPYGHRNACGVREAGIAASIGFESAVTTYHGPLTDYSLSHRHLLPRIGIGARTSLAMLDVKLSGLQSAMTR